MLPIYKAWAPLSPADVDDLEVWQAAALFDEGSPDDDDPAAMMEAARRLAEVGIEAFDAGDAWPA